MSKQKRYRKILKMRREKKLTFKQIGEKLNISRQRVQQIYKRGIEAGL